MTQNSLPFRQVNPRFVREGRITSQVFRPTPKDKKLLSVYDGDLITARDAYRTTDQWEDRDLAADRPDVVDQLRMHLV